MYIPYIDHAVRYYKKIIGGRKSSARCLFVVLAFWFIIFDIKVLQDKPWLDGQVTRMVAEDTTEPVIDPKEERDISKKRNEERLQILEQSCKNLGFPEPQNETDIRAHISPKRSVLYCRINKCASSYTLEVMRRVFGCDTDCLINIANQVKTDSENTNAIMKNAFSFLIVRDPYRRLWSTYGNMYYFPKQNWLLRGAKVIEQVRDHPSSESLAIGKDVTFVEVIKYIVKKYEQNLYLDEFIRPMHHRTCSPCTFKYDYIAKVETFTTDLDYLLNYWNSENIIGDYNVDMLSRLREWIVMGPVKHFYTEIPSIKISKIPLYDMFLRTWTYYQQLGHVSKHIPMPYLKEDVAKIGINDYQKTLKNALELSDAERRDVKSQKLEAMKQAYATVPMEYMERLSKIVRTDCLLFGYEEKPAYLFDRSTLAYNDTEFDYYKGF